MVFFVCPEYTSSALVITYITILLPFKENRLKKWYFIFHFILHARIKTERWSIYFFIYFYSINCFCTNMTFFGFVCSPQIKWSRETRSLQFYIHYSRIYDSQSHSLSEKFIKQETFCSISVISPLVFDKKKDVYIEVYFYYSYVYYVFIHLVHDV